ncbi:hypothetical protein VNI00_018766 [Paramarasmius palmivorus]|uniref:Uncharacterized protein n=1 Tax=Paramarasmius palmivorus TaxID=297713 RepID=A0AAW0AUB0_9AGAR
MQQERDEQRRQEDIQFIEHLRKKRMRKWEDDQKDLAGVIEDQLSILCPLQMPMNLNGFSSDPMARIKIPNHSLIRISGGKPSIWRTASPVDNATTTINNLLKGASIFSDRILNSYDVMDFYKRASMFCRRLRWIVNCLEDMELRVMDLDDDLTLAYEEKRLNFQQPMTRDWIDGVIPIPE